MKYIYEIITDENTKSTVIKRTDSDGNELFIPQVSGNSDYQEYLKSINN